MINDKNIPAGATVYTCRRGLEARHVAIVEVSEHRVVKRTPAGYKIEHRCAHNGALLFKDEDYFIGTDKQEVARAVKEDLRKQMRKMQDLIERMEQAETELNNIIYPAVPVKQ